MIVALVVLIALITLATLILFDQFADVDLETENLQCGRSGGAVGRFDRPLDRDVDVILIVVVIAFVIIGSQQTRCQQGQTTDEEKDFTRFEDFHVVAPFREPVSRLAQRYAIGVPATAFAKQD
jgi:hypothetical protein